MFTQGKILWSDGVPVIGYMVEVWDKDWEWDDFIKSGITNNQGDYSIEHKRKQDPSWYGRKKRKGDFYIKITDPNGDYIPYRSRTYNNYTGDPLTINATIPKEYREDPSSEPGGIWGIDDNERVVTRTYRVYELLGVLVIVITIVILIIRTVYVC